jgi:hypothetical protein
MLRKASDRTGRAKEGAHGGTMGSPVLKLECGIHVEEKDT